MTTIDNRYEGALRCHSRHGPSGCELETDAPTDNQGKGERFSPTDLVATAHCPNGGVDQLAGGSQRAALGLNCLPAQIPSRCQITSRLA